MSRAAAPNFHQDEESIVKPVDTTTASVFDTIETKLGSASQSAFVKLNAALNDILTLLNKLVNDINEKKRALDTNLGTVDYSVIRIPTPSVPDLSGASQTINQVVGGYTAPDIEALYQSVALAQHVRIPSAITNFEKAKLSLVGAKLDGDIAEILLAQDNVNAIKQAIAPKLPPS